MLERDFSPRNVSAWWKRTVVIAGGGALSFLLWTLPKWGVFWGNVARFPVLWQISSNRSIIVSLILAMCAPLLLMGILALLVWMDTQIRANSEMEAGGLPGPTHHQTGQRALSSQMGAMRQSGTLPLGSVGPVPSLSAGVHQYSRSLAQNSVPAGEEEEAEEKQEHGTDDPAALSFIVVQPVIATNGHGVVADPLIAIRLLKDVTLTLCIPGGRRVVVPLTLNAKRIQLLAYIAWRRGELINRDKILEHIFGWGLRDEDATEDRLSERFESHKKLLRRKIREIVAEQVNNPAGRQVIDPGIDPFISNAGFWGLSSICRVEDLDEIERLHQVIALARKDGTLGGDAIPEDVKTACEHLIVNYAGDFLETIIKKYPGEFKSWEGHSSWVRKPYTHYRDYYLDALWYLAVYEWRAGQHFGEEVEKAIQVGDEQKQQESLRQQMEYFGRAAQRYQSYAMYACNSKFDSKATFGAHGEYGERIGMSERALRRCVVLLGAIGRTDLVNQVWSGYRSQMKRISDHRWQPSKETQADVEAASAQTNAYRFSAQMSPRSGEFADRGRAS